MPKQRGKHKNNRLTNLKVQKLNKAGRYGDGLGLYLIVTASGSKQWVLRIIVNGKRRDIGLGGYPTTSLSEARATTMEMRRLARNGKDPVAIRNEKKKVVPTFEEAARQVHSNNIPTWKEGKAVQQWISSLENYAFPHIGGMKVDSVRPSHILNVLSPIWVEKHSTADRVRQRMSRVFDWAKTQEYLVNDNPVAGIQRGLPNVSSKPKHFASMPYTDLSDFIKHLKSSTQSDNVKLGIEFLILTVCRSGELRFAEWSEINFETKRWEIPSKRMKAKVEHHVPLSDRCLEILRSAKKLSGNSRYIFPSSQNWARTMSDSTLSKALKKGLGYPYTIHGFRSSFKDWASETRAYPNDVVEMALAHTNPNKVEAAYKRGNLFEKRKVLMDDWSHYCKSEGN